MKRGVSTKKLDFLEFFNRFFSRSCAVQVYYVSPKCKKGVVYRRVCFTQASVSHLKWSYMYHSSIFPQQSARKRFTNCLRKELKQPGLALLYIWSAFEIISLLFNLGQCWIIYPFISKFTCGKLFFLSELYELEQIERKVF